MAAMVNVPKGSHVQIDAGGVRGTGGGRGRGQLWLVGGFPKWLVDFVENPSYKWMINGGKLISGNQQLSRPRETIIPRVKD